MDFLALNGLWIGLGLVVAGFARAKTLAHLR
jgi:hypothetical protein